MLSPDHYPHLAPGSYTRHEEETPKANGNVKRAKQMLNETPLVVVLFFTRKFKF